VRVARATSSGTRHTAYGASPVRPRIMSKIPQSPGCVDVLLLEQSAKGCLPSLPQCGPSFDCSSSFWFLRWSCLRRSNPLRRLPRKLPRPQLLRQLWRRPRRLSVPSLRPFPRRALCRLWMLRPRRASSRFLARLPNRLPNLLRALLRPEATSYRWKAAPLWTPGILLRLARMKRCPTKPIRSLTRSFPTKCRLDPRPCRSVLRVPRKKRDS
jgi:hypothetical protein